MRICSILLAALAATVFAGEVQPGPPPLPQLLQDLRSMDASIRHRAQGWFFFLDRAGLDVVEQSYDKQGGAMDGTTPLWAAQIILDAGMARKRAVDVLLTSRGQMHPLFGMLSPAEMQPLCEKAADRLEADLARIAAAPPRKGPPDQIYPPVAVWADIAARTGDVRLLKAAATMVAAGVDFGGGLCQVAAVDWLAACASKLERSDADTRKRLLAIPRTGFTAPPPKILLALLRDPDAHIRAAAIGLVAGSTDPQAIDLVWPLAGDADQEVRDRAASAILSLQANPGAFRRLATEARFPAWHRAMAWQRLLVAPMDPAAVAAAKTAFSDKSEPECIATIAEGLGRLGEVTWTFDRLSGLEPGRRMRALSALVRLGDPTVVEAAKAMLGKASEQDAVSLINALGGAAKEVETLPALIGLLGDQRPAVRNASRQAIEQRSGLTTASGTNPGGDPATERAQTARIATLWRTWWDIHRSDVGSPLREWQLLRQAGCDKDPAAALYELASIPGDEADRALLFACDDPQFVRQREPLLEALAKRAPSPAMQAALSAGCASGDPWAIRLACRWRSAPLADAVLEAALVRGVAWEQVKAGLVAWWPPKLDALIRTATAPAKPAPPGTRGQPIAYLSRAMEALALRGGSDDAGTLAGLILRPDADVAMCARGLVNMGEAATPGLIRLLDPKTPQPVSRAVLMALYNAACGGTAPSAQLLPALRLQAAAKPRQPAAGAVAGTSIDQGRGQAIALLAAAGDAEAESQVRGSGPGAWESCADALLNLRQPAASPCILLLLDTAPNPEAGKRCLAWQEQVGGIPAARLAQLRAEAAVRSLKAQEALLGKPVEGISATLGVPSGEQKGHEYITTVTVRNGRRTPVEVLIPGGNVIIPGQNGVPGSLRLAPPPNGAAFGYRPIPAGGTLKFDIQFYFGGDASYAERMRAVVSINVGAEQLRVPTPWVPIDLLSPAQRVAEANAGFK